ncbi:MAG: beta-propeller domain-containing protein [Polyangiaceae bacterium]
MSLFRTSSWNLIRVAGIIASLGVAAFGCADVEGSGSGQNQDGFISDSPNGGNKNGGGEDAGAGGSDSGTTTSTSTGTDNAGAEKAIIEADIIQVHGDELFALSQYGGLSVIDMANPADLHLLGNYRVQGVPFEMYMQDGIVYAMYSSFGTWSCSDNGDSCEYLTSSHIEALDVTNPAHITKVGSFDLPGEISDSRIVGDVLYAVSYENGYCWNCANEPETTVTSIQVGDPAHINVVDSLSFSDQDTYSWGWRRSISVTQDRMYVAGIEWDGQGEGHSTIQVVDITDPTGLLQLGAAVEVAGQIESRWQMDEKDSVLRVISQPGVWWDNGVPAVQTFQVNGASSIVPIASKNLVLPKPERLRAARFDGDRLFAITAEQQDPLFTIDVSDPAHPQQLGQVELPGWIYYLEPHGDRLFALGFDNTAQEGSMNVSLFDVADLANPSLIQRVNFGGDWSWAPEDQDRIHKAFKVDNDLGTVFVPYGAYDWTSDGNSYYCGKVESGVQMVDFTHDSLTKRGSAPMHGVARRALMHNDTLFTVSDDSVQSFDITDRDSPAAVDMLPLNTWADQSVRVGNYVIRVASDWWTNASRLDVVPANDPNKAEPLGTLDLAEAVQDGLNDCYGWGFFYGARLFPLDAHRVALTWTDNNWYYDGANEQYKDLTHVAVVNLTNVAHPAVEGHLTMNFGTNFWGWSSDFDGGEAVVKIGNQLVFRALQSTWDQATNTSTETASLEVADLTNPAAPSHTASIPLPEGSGHSLLQKSGNQVLTSHWEPVPNMPGKVRFYLDRETFVYPNALPIESTNVPGALVAFDSATQHAMTIDFHQVNLPQNNADDCWATGYGQWNWDDNSYTDGYCYYMQHTLKLIALDGDDVSILDTKSVSPTMWTYNTKVTEDRIFTQTWSYDPVAGVSHEAVVVLSPPSENTITMASASFPTNEWMYGVAAEGNHVILASYATPGIYDLDATDMDNLMLQKKSDVMSYIYSVTLDGDRALCSMGPYGIQAVDLQ